MIPGTPERRSHDYVRHGTIDLFAALNTATGKVIGQLSAQHRAVDFRDFLDQIDRQTEPGLAIHVICDNLSAHKAPAVHRWLLAHPRVQLHFTPTYSSWISQVERWFAELQRRCLDRGVFCSLDELTTALEDWIKIWNASARPFKWTKTADQIIDRICRYCSRISGPGHYATLITAAHQELKAPVILIWDRLNTHISAVMRAFIQAHPGWLTEVRLPAYAPELNPAEGAWAAMKASLGNLAVRDVDQLAAIMKNRLKRIQYRPALIEAFLGQAGLTFDPQPP